ncbi:MAG: hypothetical protein GY926_14170 [bacterium]|nr:hypothetical protein [bacterium]
MRRFAALVLLLSLVGVPAASGQESVDVADLLEAPIDYIGEVSVVGELIGDYGFRSDDSMWTQLNDDSYAFDPVLDDGALTGGNIGVAVRIPAELAASLDPPGGYRVRGPVVEATGVWKYHDPDRGGETYIDVVGLTVVESGRGLTEHPTWLVGAFGFVLIAYAIFMRLRSGPRRG